MSFIKTPKFKIDYLDVNDHLNDEVKSVTDFPKLKDKYEFLIDNKLPKNRTNFADEYKKLSYEFYHASIHILRYVLDHRDYNDVIDFCSIPMMFNIRHAIELILKAAILKQRNNKKNTQEIFHNNAHNISNLYNILNTKPNNNSWLDKYLINITQEDPSENLFRYSMNNNFRSEYTFINSIQTMLVSIYAYNCLTEFYFGDHVISEKDIDKFKENVVKYSPNGEYLIKENHGFGHMYTWQTDEQDLYKQVVGFRDAGKILFLCISNKIQVLDLPMLYSLRHSLEISLKSIITMLHRYIKDHLKKPGFRDIPDKAYATHDFKEIWEYGKRIMAFFVTENNWDPKKLEEIDAAIMYIRNVDKKAGYFRYPTDKSFIYNHHNNIDYEKAYNTFIELIELMENFRYIIEDMNDSVNEMLYMEYNDYE